MHVSLACWVLVCLGVVGAFLVSCGREVPRTNNQQVLRKAAFLRQVVVGVAGGSCMLLQADGMATLLGSVAIFPLSPLI